MKFVTAMCPLRTAVNRSEPPRTDPSARSSRRSISRVAAWDDMDVTSSMSEVGKLVQLADGHPLLYTVEEAAGVLRIGRTLRGRREQLLQHARGAWFRAPTRAATGRAGTRHPAIGSRRRPCGRADAPLHPNAHTERRRSRRVTAHGTAWAGAPLWRLKPKPVLNRCRWPRGGGSLSRSRSLRPRPRSLERIQGFPCNGVNRGELRRPFGWYGTVRPSNGLLECVVRWRREHLLGRPELSQQPDRGDLLCGAVAVWPSAGVRNRSDADEAIDAVHAPSQSQVASCGPGGCQSYDGGYSNRDPSCHGPSHCHQCSPAADSTDTIRVVAVAVSTAAGGQTSRPEHQRRTTPSGRCRSALPHPGVSHAVAGLSAVPHDAISVHGGAEFAGLDDHRAAQILQHLAMAIVNERTPIGGDEDVAPVSHVGLQNEGVAQMVA